MVNPCNVIHVLERLPRAIAASYFLPCILSSIGDNVNVAARLEGLTKDLACGIVISAKTADAANVDLSAYDRHDVEVRGRGETISVFALPEKANPFAKEKMPA